MRSWSCSVVILRPSLFLIRLIIFFFFKTFYLFFILNCSKRVFFRHLFQAILRKIIGNLNWVIDLKNKLQLFAFILFYQNINMSTVTCLSLLTFTNATLSFRKMQLAVLSQTWKNSNWLLKRMLKQYKRYHRACQNVCVYRYAHLYGRTSDIVGHNLRRIYALWCKPCITKGYPMVNGCR